MASTAFDCRMESGALHVAGEGAAEGKSFRYQLDFRWLDHPSPELFFDAQYQDTEQVTCTESCHIPVIEYVPLSEI